MSYPPPPGIASAKPVSPAPPGLGGAHPSLPARPSSVSNSLPSKAEAAAAHISKTSGTPGTQQNGKATPTGAPGTSSAGPSFAFTGFKPRSVAGGASANQWQARPQASSPTIPPTGFAPSPQPGAYNYGTYQQYPQQPQTYYKGATPADPYSATATPPQIRNPFPAPGQNQAGYGRGAGRGYSGNAMYDPEYEEAVRQWQSAYAAKDDSDTNKVRMGGRAGLGRGDSGVTYAVGPEAVGPATPADTTATAAGAQPEKQKTVVRQGGGQSWQDSTLLEWNPAHFRIFVGNLAGEVTDESLLKAFSRYKSVQKARVIRDKRTTKSKGYGFVSFADGDDMFQAAKEMNGKYIGSHPVLIKRSTTEIKPTAPPDHRKGKGGGKWNKGDRAGSGAGHSNGGGGAGHGGGGKDVLGANTGAGVKKHDKKKGGLKILG